MLCALLGLVLGVEMPAAPAGQQKMSFKEGTAVEGLPFKEKVSMRGC